MAGCSIPREVVCAGRSERAPRTAPASPARCDPNGVRWPQRFYDLKRGEGCPFCVEGRPDETAHGIRFFAGELADAYLSRGGVQRGLSHVYFRGRHVVEPTDRSEEHTSELQSPVHLVCRLL